MSLKTYLRIAIVEVTRSNRTGLRQRPKVPVNGVRELDGEGQMVDFVTGEN